MYAVERRGLGMPMNDQQMDLAQREVANGMIVGGQDKAINRSNGMTEDIRTAQPVLAADCMELRYSIARLTDERSLNPNQQAEYVALEAEEIILSALRRTVINNPNDTLDLLTKLESQEPKAAMVAAFVLGQTIDGTEQAGVINLPIGSTMDTFEEAISEVRLDGGVATVAAGLNRLVLPQPQSVAA